MIVRCISTHPDDKQIEQLCLKDRAGEFLRRSDFGLELGEEYLVLGIAFYLNNNTWGTGAYIEYLDEMAEGPMGLILTVPICLFEIVDGRSSKYWEARRGDTEVLTLKPPSFYRQNYYVDMAESEPEVVKDFIQVYNLLKSEHE